MNINEFCESLNKKSTRNNALQFIESIIVDKDKLIVKILADIIQDPSSIEDTNRFASLLSDLPSCDYISPLIKMVSEATPGQTPWLADYMYALGELLGRNDESWPVEESFVHLMGTWLLSPDCGEISWKSSLILEELDHPATRQYFFPGAFDDKLFHQTRIACIRGIVNHYRDEALPVLQALKKDSNEYVRQSAADGYEWLLNK